MKNWKIIDDNKVRHCWKCPDCEKKFYVSPDYYEELGRPICLDCNIDAEYLRTEIKND